MKLKLPFILTTTLLFLLAAFFLPFKVVMAADTDTVAATVTAVIYSVSLDNGDGIAFGSVSQSSSADTSSTGVDDSTTATNDGSVAAKFNIKAVDSTGGTGWTLGAAAGSETYAMKFCITDCDGSPTWNAVGTSPSYATLVASVNAAATQIFDLQVSTPTSTVETTEQAITVTIQAVAP